MKRVREAVKSVKLSTDKRYIDGRINLRWSGESGIRLISLSKINKTLTVHPVRARAHLVAHCPSDKTHAVNDNKQ